jgi:hypothetical protein
MTPQEKAAELVRKFKPLVTFSMGVDPSYVLRIAKKCALVEVDDILKVVQSLNRHDTEYIRDEHIPYWEEVKQEIEKL